MTALPRLKARVKLNFPAVVSGTDGVGVTKTNGAYSISLDIDGLEDTATLTTDNFGDFNVPVYNEQTGAYTKLPLDTLRDGIAVDFPVSDASFVLEDDGDSTKKLKFQLSGITTATTRTLTAPDASTTIVGTDTTQTLSNKTLTAPTLNTPTMTAPVLGVATGTSLALGGASLGSNVLGVTGAIGASGTIRGQNAAAIGAGGTAGTGFLFSSTANFGLTYGSGAPTLSVAQGSVYLRSDGVPYYNTNGTTGWDALVGAAATQTLTNKTLTSPAITTPTGIVKGDVGLGNVDNTSDATKNSAVATLTNKTLTAPVISTISNTGTLTLPTSTDTLVGRATTDTLTNKTLTAPVISTITNTGTLTLPTSTDTLVGRATTDTLTNKTISGSSNTLSNIANASLSTAAAYTIKGNATGSSATPTDISISALTTKASPVAGDYVLLSDGAASGALKKVDASSFGTASIPGQAFTPGFVLTLTSGVAVSDTDVTGATTLYATPSSGNVCPVYDGTSFVLKTASELTLALDATSGHTGYHQSGKNFDCFIINDSGTIRVGTGPAWTSDTSRGTGAGTTELTKLNGMLVNANTITIRFGSASGNTVSVAANQATFIGSFRASADGTTEDSRSKRLVSNAYYPCPRPVRVIDTTDTWAYSTAAYRQANGSTANQFEYLHCLGGRRVNAEAVGFALNSTATQTGVRTGIGIDATSADSSILRYGATVTNGNPFVFARALYDGTPGIGYHYFAWLEYGAGTADTQTWRGDNGGVGTFQLGMIGQVYN